MTDSVQRIQSLPETSLTEPIYSGPSTNGNFFSELARAYERRAAARSLAPKGPAPTIPFAARSSRASARLPKGNFGQPPADAGNLHALVVAAARQEGVPPPLLAAVVQAESNFNPRAVSRAGAKGLTQLMDGTAAGLGVHDPFDPWQNLVGGARYLHGLLQRYDGNVTLALAGYNAGPGAVDAAGRQVPNYPETRTYVQRVTAYYRQFAAEYPGGAG